MTDKFSHPPITKLIKSISNKPLLVTARDAVIVMIVTLIVTLICAWLYYKLMSDENNAPDWKMLIMKTTAATFALAFVYEYTGINNMLSESSMRYAKGTTLSKYTSRREAMLYECMYKLLSKGEYSDRKSEIDENMKILRWLITHTNSRGKLAEAANHGKSYLDAAIAKSITSDRGSESIIMTIAKLDIDVIKNIDVLGDRITENIAYHLLVNGLQSFKNLETAEEQGTLIRDKCCTDDDTD